MKINPDHDPIILTLTDSVVLGVNLTLAAITLREAGYGELAHHLRRVRGRLRHAETRARVWIEDEEPDKSEPPTGI